MGVRTVAVVVVACVVVVVPIVCTVVATDIAVTVDGHIVDPVVSGP